MIPVALWLLATLDAAFAGYREAAGRNALINKRRYYCRAMLRGALYGQFAVAVTGLLILSWGAFSDQREALVADLMKAGQEMLVIYLPFAFVMLLAFLIRTIASVDLRSVTSTVIFGPFTLIRPLVLTAGVVLGVFASPHPVNFALGLVVLILMLSTERALSWMRMRRPAGP